MSNDLTNRTVVFDGDIDQMGVVVYDGKEQRVRVWLNDRPLTRVHYMDGAEYIDRDRLEDVTDDFDLAKEWGLVEDDEDEDED